jgi:hypothetical protein
MLFSIETAEQISQSNILSKVRMKRKNTSIKTMPFVKVVACSYVVEPQLLAIKIDSLFKQYGVFVSGVIISNNLMHEFVGYINKWEIIRGSNKTLDFSAYIEGLMALNSAEDNPSTIIFLNDSLFFKHSPRVNISGIMRFFDLINTVKIPTILGKADTYMTLCFSNPWSNLPIYISSYCFALNESAQKILMQLADYARQDGLNVDFTEYKDDWGARLQPNFRQYLMSYCLQDSPYRWGQNNSINYGLLNKKARAVYFEHRLSGEIGKLGCIIPTNDTRRSKIIYLILEKLSHFGIIV